MAYVPREYTFHGVETHAEGWRFKLYSIREASREAPSTEDWDAARRALAEVPLAGECAGFVILHMGGDADYLLLDWWTHECILAQRLLMRPIGGAEFRPPEAKEWVACVYELRVIEREAQAWIASAMKDDFARYFDWHFSGWE